MPRPVDAPVVPELELRRQATVDTLTTHFAHGRLALPEFETRLEGVEHASSATELAALTADLPPAITESFDPRGIKALFSGQERKVLGAVGPRLEVRVRAGYVELDLTGATFEPGITEIDVRVLAGYVQIYLPAGVQVDSAGGALAGYFTVSGGTPGSDRLVRLTGRATLGFIECFVAPAHPRELPAAL